MRKQFNRKKLEKLNNPERLGMIPPEYIWKTLAPDHHTDKVEIGAGTGLFSKAFQELSGEGHTIALDISEEMVTWMKENIIEEFPQIIPMKTNGKNLPLADNSADIVFMICLHHEIESPEALLSEVRRILRNSGKMFIVDWNKNNSGGSVGSVDKFRLQKCPH